jgi:hypothetical protein
MAISSGQAFGQVPEVGLQVLPVLLPRLAVDAGGGPLLQVEVGLPQAGDVIYVVPEAGEPQLLIPTSCLSYPIQRALQVLGSSGLPY